MASSQGLYPELRQERWWGDGPDFPATAACREASRCSDRRPGSCTRRLRLTHTAGHVAVHVVARRPCGQALQVSLPALQVNVEPAAHGRAPHFSGNRLAVFGLSQRLAQTNVLLEGPGLEVLTVVGKQDRVARPQALEQLPAFEIGGLAELLSGLFCSSCFTRYVTVSSSRRPCPEYQGDLQGAIRDGRTP